MKWLITVGLIPIALTAAAQTMDHSSMPGMVMPGDAAKPSTKSAPAADQRPSETQMPSARTPAKKAVPMDHSSMPGMVMPATQAPSPDHASMPGMDMSGAANAPGHDMANMDQAEIPHTSPPPPPADHAADQFFPSAAMADARAQLQREHGGMQLNKVMVNLAEYQVRNGKDGYRWEGQAWYGGDINRFVLKSEGEGTRGEGVDSAELQALYSRAIGVYTDVQAGIRQDFEPHSRSYATIGLETMSPYWFDFQAAAFLSTKGEVLARFEGTNDLLLTNRLILQPRAELNFSAQNTPATQTGSGLSNAELGLRLRYEITREFAPYIGVSWDQKFGKTADYAHAFGKEVTATSFVFGIRTFF
ncbi:MAG: copper resistance protein B [Pseudomonadota bacterium]